MLVCLFTLLITFFHYCSGMKCNGMKELCDLRLNQVTLPGTHNSGSGAGSKGHLYLWSGAKAVSRNWRNQQWDIPTQLDYGIRWFDIDTCYVDKNYSDWWTKGAWICHMGGGTNAYAMSVKEMLEEINDWMNKPNNANEVIVIQFGRDVEVDFKPEKIYESILSDVKRLGWKPTPATKQAKTLTTNAEWGSTRTWPTLREAINSNQRIFLFFSEKLLKFKQPNEFLNNKWILNAERKIKITWPQVSSMTCSGIVPKLAKNCENFNYDTSALLELDVFAFNLLVSTWVMQEYCDKHMQEAMDKCSDKIKTVGKTVNAVLADWVDRSKSPNTVLDVARKQNERNIAMYKGK